MAIEDTLDRMELLGCRIKEGTASKLEAIEWLELTSNGNPIKDAAIELLKAWATSDYGDGYFDGFIKAQTLYEANEDLSDYSKDTIMEMSESAESKCEN